MDDAEGRRLPGNLWPVAADVREDRESRLWVAVRVPDMQWPNAVSTVASIEGERVVINDPKRARDTIVDVFDLQAGTLLVSARFDPSLYAFIGDDEIVSSSHEEDGSSRVHIWRLSLHHPPPR